MTHNNERDELVDLLENAIDDAVYFAEAPPSLTGTVARYSADAVLAAGYVKPRQVTTVEELDALPVGKVVILRDSKHEAHPAQKGEHGWRLPFVDDFWTSAELLAGSTASAELVES